MRKNIKAIPIFGAVAVVALSSLVIAKAIPSTYFYQNTSSDSLSSNIFSPFSETTSSSTDINNASSQTASSEDTKDALIESENTRHEKAIKNLNNDYNTNMAIFDELAIYSQEQITATNKFNNETDSNAKEEYRTEINKYSVLIFKDLKKVVPILYPDLKNMKSIEDFDEYFTKANRPSVSDKVLRYEMQQKYNKDIDTENNKHTDILKQIG